MVDNELQLKITADNRSVKQAFEDIKAQTEDLEGSLNKIAKISGVAFAALTAQVFVAVKEFGEAQKSSMELTQALQNQGIYTDDLKASYKSYAEQVEKTTGIQADEIIKSQAVAQSFLGQVPITQKLTNAIADLAEQQGIGLPAAAEQLGKAIGEGTGMLLRQGLQFAATDTEAERYQKTLEFVQVKAGGFAESANQGIGSMRGLETAFKNAQQELGQRFAPAVEAIIKGLTTFLTPSKEATGLMVDFKAALIIAGLAVSGLGVALPLLANGFLAVRAAAQALNIGLSTTRLALAGLGIGLVITAVVELALNWETASTRIITVVKAMVTTVSAAFTGLKAVLDGAFHLDSAKILEGLHAITDAFKTGVQVAFQALPVESQKAATIQEALRKKFADKAAADRKAADSIRKQLAKAEDEAIILELTNASAKQIALKKKEIETLKALEQKNSKDQVALLKQRLTQIRQLEANQIAQDKERAKEFADFQLTAEADLNAQKVEFAKDVDAEELASLQAKIETEKDVRQKAYIDELDFEIQKHNKFLEEQNRYGIAYATIDQIMHSKIYMGSKQAFGELAQLTQSSNTTLKQIGKIAAISNIIMKTAESAMNIYAGFSTIPIVGQALGVAGAAAAVVFGAEQANTVRAAKAGGVVEGVGYGDKVPFLLEPNELVVPRQNFNEVVDSVAKNRSNGNSAPSTSGAVVEIRLKDKLMDFIETKIVERKNLRISIQGA